VCYHRTRPNRSSPDKRSGKPWLQFNINTPRPGRKAPAAAFTPQPKLKVHIANIAIPKSRSERDFQLHCASPKPNAGRPPSAATVDARFTALKRSRTSPWILWRSSRPANTIQLTSGSRTKPCCTLSSIPGSAWRLNTVMERQATGVVSSAGR
jgi:hypothetical protein